MAEHGHHWIEGAEGVECGRCGKTPDELREGQGSHSSFPSCEAEQDCDCEICELAIELGDERMAHARTIAERDQLRAQPEARDQRSEDE